MSAAAVLVVVVAIGDAHATATEALLAAAQSALPAETIVRLMAVPDPEHVDLSRLADGMGAKAVATVAWHRSAGSVRASVKIQLAGEPRSTARTIIFSARDTASERGRTLGFAIASMWPEPTVAAPRAGPEAAAPGPPPANDNGRPPQPPASRAGVPSAEQVAPAEAPPETTPAPADATAARPPEPSPFEPRPEGVGTALATSTATVRQPAMPIPARMGLGVGALGAIGLGGPARALGGGVELVWRVAPTWGFRGLVTLRGGPIPELPGSGWVAAAGVGTEWWPRALTLGSLAVGTRGELLWTGHWIRRQAITDPATSATSTPAESHGRMLPAVSAGIRIAWALGGSLHLLLGAGFEVALGRTDLRTGEERQVKVSVPPARGMADIAVRVSF